MIQATSPKNCHQKHPKSGTLEAFYIHHNHSTSWSMPTHSCIQSYTLVCQKLQKFCSRWCAKNWLHLGHSAALTASVVHFYCFTKIHFLLKGINQQGSEKKLQTLKSSACCRPNFPKVFASIANKLFHDQIFYFSVCNRKLLLWESKWHTTSLQALEKVVCNRVMTAVYRSYVRHAHIG